MHTRSEEHDLTNACTLKKNSVCSTNTNGFPKEFRPMTNKCLMKTSINWFSVEK